MKTREIVTVLSDVVDSKHTDFPTLTSSQFGNKVTI